MEPTYQELLEEAFPASFDRAVISGVRQGILLANAVMENEIFLKTLVGGDLRGHLRRAAVLYRVHEMCKAGDLPFSSVMDRMPRGGGHWVELRSGDFKAHICRTDGPAAFPDDTPTRQDERRTNQPGLFDQNVVPLHRTPSDLEQMYAWLTFGATGKSITHLCWAMPAASLDDWLARINVLRRVEQSADVEASAPPPTAVLRFREHVEETLRAKKDDGEATDKA
ncbi:hypothetical protein KY084_00845 [Stakelama sp. CBK3Z-3]|uniref:Uncharacterized protein n=1 Tax=Stakelama flava TaxID=2860338 RepID=A0ABS6XGU0_9SPHN|nr:hypothetical protein [Stakelama flava]MBW4329425.1 hypothetical protein [Stakelama flava]